MSNDGRCVVAWPEGCYPWAPYRTIRGEILDPLVEAGAKPPSEHGSNDSRGLMQIIPSTFVNPEGQTHPAEDDEMRRAARAFLASIYTKTTDETEKP